MIIECPQCKKKFLAPDDLEENQLLKCGYCNYEWQLKTNDKKIPNNIKPTEYNHSEDFKSIESTDSSKMYTVIISILVIFIIGWTVLHFKKELSKLIASNGNILELENHEKAPDNSLVFKNLNAVEEGDFIRLTGEVHNTSNIKTKIPDIKISDKYYNKSNKEYILGNEVIFIDTKLPKDIGTNIKVSF